MDWLNRSWKQEDAAYAPKRYVNNKGSQQHPHVIGSFYSPKMQRDVEYESLGEYLFYCLLELDKQTVRYYVQPVHVPIPFLDEYGKRSHWMHVPDVLVFRQDYAPKLYQVKERPSDPSDEASVDIQRLNHYCAKFASERGWNYEVVYPKAIPAIIEKNAKFLVGFLEPRADFELLIPEVISRMQFLGASTVEELSRGFQGKAHPFLVLPIIWHLVANGTFAINAMEVFNEHSRITVSSAANNSSNFLLWEAEA